MNAKRYIDIIQEEIDHREELVAHISVRQCSCPQNAPVAL